jgi:four helix bundle protein
MTPQELRKRTYQFALDSLRLFKQLPKVDEARIIGKQLLRSSTGAAANYRASCRARSPKEFAAKIGVVLEESDESVMWLRLIIDGEIQSGKTLQQLLTEARELTAIFAASYRTAKRRLRKKRPAGAKTTQRRKAMSFEVDDVTGKLRRR